MKAKALSVRECIWESEECHLGEEIPGDLQTKSVCLPNIFRSKKVRPLTRILTGPTYQVYYTARELLLKVLDRGAIQKLIRRAAGMRAVANRQSYNQSREQSASLSEGEYTEALTWFSIVLQNGVSEGVSSRYDPELTLTLDGWQGFLKRNSFQSSLVSLTRLEDGEKLEILSAFCGHIARCYQALYTPGQNLVVKKYRLFYQKGSCSLHLALLCDVSSGFICNMLLYCPDHLQRQSRRPVVEQVVEHLLRPFCSQRLTVQLDSSAWMDSTLADTFSSLGVDIHFIPTVTRKADPTAPEPRLQTPEDAPVQFSAHLQGWTGPALFPLSDPKGSEADVFLPGIWVTLHVVCINTFILHTLQNQGSGKQVHLTEFTRTLASQLTMDSSTTVPGLPRLNSISYRDTSSENSSKQRLVLMFLPERLQPSRTLMSRFTLFWSLLFKNSHHQSRSVWFGQLGQLLLLKRRVAVSVFHGAPGGVPPSSGHSSRTGRVRPQHPLLVLLYHTVHVFPPLSITPPPTRPYLTGLFLPIMWRVLVAE